MFVCLGERGKKRKDKQQKEKWKNGAEFRTTHVISSSQPVRGSSATFARSSQTKTEDAGARSMSQPLLRPRSDSSQLREHHPITNLLGINLKNFFAFFKRGHRKQFWLASFSIEPCTLCFPLNSYWLASFSIEPCTLCFPLNSYLFFIFLFSLFLFLLLYLFINFYLFG